MSRRCWAQVARSLAIVRLTGHRPLPTTMQAMHYSLIGIICLLGLLLVRLVRSRRRTTEIRKVKGPKSSSWLLGACLPSLSAEMTSFIVVQVIWCGRMLVCQAKVLRGCAGRLPKWQYSSMASSVRPCSAL